jgi:hypothetical protein
MTKLIVVFQNFANAPNNDNEKVMVLIAPKRYKNLILRELEMTALGTSFVSAGFRTPWACVILPHLATPWACVTLPHLATPWACVILPHSRFLEWHWYRVDCTYVSMFRKGFCLQFQGRLLGIPWKLKHQTHPKPVYNLIARQIPNIFSIQIPSQVPLL